MSQVDFQSGLNVWFLLFLKRWSIKRKIFPFCMFVIWVLRVLLTHVGPQYFSQSFFSPVYEWCVSISHPINSNLPSQNLVFYNCDTAQVEEGIFSFYFIVCWCVQMCQCPGVSLARPDPIPTDLLLLSTCCCWLCHCLWSGQANAPVQCWLALNYWGFCEKVLLPKSVNVVYFPDWTQTKPRLTPKQWLEWRPPTNNIILHCEHVLLFRLLILPVV